MAMSKYCIFCWSDNVSDCEPIVTWRLKRYAVPPALIDAYSHEHCAKVEAIKQMREERLAILSARRNFPEVSGMTDRYTLGITTTEIIVPAVDSVSLLRASPRLTSPSGFHDSRIAYAQSVHSLTLGACQVQYQGWTSGQTSPYLPEAPALFREISKNEFNKAAPYSQARSALREILFADVATEGAPVNHPPDPKAPTFKVAPEDQVFSLLNPRALPFYCPSSMTR